MNIIAWIVLGVIAGWLASVLMKTNAQQGIVKDMVLGVIGAIIGGFAVSTLGGQGITGFNLYSLAVATLGAAGLIAAQRALSR